MWRSLGVGLLTVVTTFAAQVARADSAEPLAKHCQHFQSIRLQTAPALGRLIDPITRLAAIDLQCEGQYIHFKQELMLSEQALKGDWLKRQRDFWTATYCKPGSEAEAAIRSGWTVATTITTRDGAHFHFTARCSEVMAQAGALPDHG